MVTGHFLPEEDDLLFEDGEYSNLIVRAGWVKGEIDDVRATAIFDKSMPKLEGVITDMFLSDDVPQGNSNKWVCAAIIEKIQE